MDDKDHQDMIDALVNIEGMALVSGYTGFYYYQKLEAYGWTRQDFGAVTTASLNKERDMRRVESLWLCPRTTAAAKQLSLF
jgi:hypothetical protein